MTQPRPCLLPNAGKAAAAATRKQFGRRSHLCVNYLRAVVEMTGGGRRFVQNGQKCEEESQGRED